VWGIDFMGPFKNSHGYEHILVMVDYVSKWVEVIPCRKASTEESNAMIKSMIFPHFGTLRIDKRWRNSLHWEEFQKVLVQVRN
jgi:hypothetical protein